MKIIELIDQEQDLKVMIKVRNAAVSRVERLSQRQKYDLLPGTKVVVEANSKLDREEEGTIIRVNRTKAVVSIGIARWTVPLSMITIKEDG
tara:strand:+ start:1032 stop:1304 length:273 start_codon:yes stop_codon:yes gene_type:complete